MTELEALKKVLDAAEWADQEMAEPGKPDLASALPLVEALIARVEKAETDPKRRYELVEASLRDLGLVLVDTVDLDFIRDCLRERGRDDLAAMSNTDLAAFVEHGLSEALGKGSGYAEIIGEAREGILDHIEGASTEVVE